MAAVTNNGAALQYAELNNVMMSVVLNPTKYIKTKTINHTIQNNLLRSFLLNEPIENIVDDVDIDSLLCVTKLDDSQKQAIREAMNSRVSVITGAPGTGKTQVIENLLVNALVRGKKVLVASKNNKAVDNVKERFDEIDKTGYLLRF